MKLFCSVCGRVVSNDLGKGAVVRAIIECPECFSADEGVEGERRRCTELAERHKLDPSFDLVLAIQNGDAQRDKATAPPDGAAAAAATDFDLCSRHS